MVTVNAVYDNCAPSSRLVGLGSPGMVSNHFRHKGHKEKKTGSLAALQERAIAKKN
ncbi:MAG: hypothetical protein F6K47_06285 [Symploca sp. SIO2E6]|nr:hypothetical protein [Symploca sp. SIO2E6]